MAAKAQSPSASGTAKGAEERRVRARLRRIFRGVGCDGYVHAVELATGRELGLGADTPVTSASVFKVQVALEFFARVASAELDPREQVLLDASARTPGPSGTSLFADPCRISLADLAVLTVTISDNAATDALIARVGLAALAAQSQRLGLSRTVVQRDCRGLLEDLGRGLGFESWDKAAAAPDLTTDDLRPLLAPERSNRTSARDSTTLLRAIWADTAYPAPACAEVRRLMAHQLSRARLASAFSRSTQVAAKSGTLMGVVRNEIGVVQPPRGPAFAVAIFTWAHPAHRGEAAINRAIGRAARIAIEHLQGQPLAPV